MNKLFGKNSQKKASQVPTVRQLSCEERNSRLEKCFQLGLKYLINTKVVRVVKNNNLTIITESPLINDPDDYLIMHWDALERNDINIKDALRHKFMYLYILHLKIA